MKTPSVAETAGRTPSSARHPPLHLIVAFAWALFLVVLMQFFEYHGWLGGFEGIVLDWWVSMSASSGRNTEPILIVEIDDESYQNCFGGHSPMPPQLIEQVVSKLAGDSKSPHPRVMGVDLLTDAPERYESLLDLSAKSGHAKLVWAAPPAPHPNVVVPGFWDWLLWGADEELVVEAGPVLGKKAGTELRAPPEFTSTRLQGDAGTSGDNSIYWAMPVYPRDQDLRVRRFPRNVFIADVGNVFTWPRAIAELQRGEQAPAGRFGDDKEVIVSYNVDFLHSFKLVDLFSCESNAQPRLPGAKASRGDPGVPKAQPEITINWKKGMAEGYQTAVESDPVVLLGGTFEFGRDTYRTSTGPISGLRINAYALAAEMAESGSRIGIREWDRRILLFLDIGVAFLIVLAFASGTTLLSRFVLWLQLRSLRLRFLTPLRQRMLFSVVPVAATLGLSYFAFRWGYMWVTCIGIALGFPLHLLGEIFLDAGHHKSVLPSTAPVPSSAGPEGADRGGVDHGKTVPDKSATGKAAHNNAGHKKPGEATAANHKAHRRKAGRHKKS